MLIYKVARLYSQLKIEIFATVFIIFSDLNELFFLALCAQLIPYYTQLNVAVQILFSNN